MRQSGLRQISYFCSLTLVFSFLSLTVSCQRRTQLPKSSEILPTLSEDPLQEELRERSFQIEHEGMEYTLHPVADYEIAGLVVTHNDISELSDIYHTSKSVDLKDLCLIWGQNLQSDEFMKVEYWSEPWSCHYRYGAEVKNFNSDELSNTHLLAGSAKVRKTIQSIHIGDQVYLRGKLVNYAPSCCAEQLRKSSLVRDDDGNGACEVMYVTEAEVLKQGNILWHQLYQFSRVTFLGALILQVILFLWITYAEVPRV